MAEDLIYWRRAGGKLTIVTSSIFDMLLTRVFTLTMVGPSEPGGERERESGKRELILFIPSERMSLRVI